MKSETPIFSAYVDGFNLYKGILESRPESKWLNLKSICRELMPHFQLHEVNYFTSRLKQRFPTDRSMERQSAYLRVLEDDQVNVIYGQFRKDLKWERLVSPRREDFIQPELRNYLGIPRYSTEKVFRSVEPDFPKIRIQRMGEKGSDVNLASYLMRDIYLNSISAVLVVTGDTDLLTPLKFAREHGAFVKVVVPGELQNVESFRANSDELIGFPVELLSDHQFPNPYRKRVKGTHIYRPQGWI